MAEKTLLQQIREKELMLNIKIEDTRKEAEEIIFAAKQQAKEMVENSEKQGKERAEAYYTNELERIKQDIEKIREQGNLEVNSIKQAGERTLQLAIEKIVTAVMME